MLYYPETYKVLLISAYIDKTYKNHIIMCSSSDSSISYDGCKPFQPPINSGGNQQWWLNQPYYLPKTLEDEEDSSSVYLSIFFWLVYLYI